MKRWLISQRKRLFWLLVLVAAGIGGLALAASDTKVDQPPVNPDVYDAVMSCQVADIYDLEQHFVSVQYGFLPIAPPQPGFSLLQGDAVEVLPFDMDKMPKEFLAGLIGTFENSVPVYPLTIMEDPVTRETLFHNADGKEIYALPPVAGYDPYAFIKQSRSWVYSVKSSYSDLLFWQGVFDPARIQLRTKLVLSKDVEYYLYAKAQVVQAQSTPAQTDIRPLGLGGSGLYTDMHFTAISRGTNAITITLSCPNAVTNVDIFTTTNTPPNWWRMDATNFASPLDTVSWVVTNPDVVANSCAISLGAGDPDIQSDIDGIPDDREFFLYHSSPSNIDSDADGLVDGYSGVVGTNSYAGGVHTNGGQFVEGELSLGSDPTNPDTDGDGVGDGTEISDGTNPLNGNDPPSVSGTITYAYPGRQTGTIWVVAVTTSNSWATNRSVRLSVPGTYQIIKTCLTNYFLKVWRDTDGNNSNDATEAFGIYAINPIVVTGKVTNINMTLTDPDNDADAVPDWWEAKYFGSITNWGTTNDPDNDTYSNFEEYQAITDPTNALSHPYNVEGSISYSGPQTGTFYVLAVTNYSSWTPVGQVSLTATGGYKLTHLPVGAIYYTRVYRDSNGSGTDDFGEAWGDYAGNPILLTNTITNVNVALVDQDADADGLPDWFEVKYGLDPNNGGAANAAAWWTLDATGGTNVLDSTVNSNNGFTVGTPTNSWTTNGVINSALNFDGLSNFVQVADSPSLRPDFVSLSLWIRPSRNLTNGMAVIYSKQAPGQPYGYSLTYSNGNLTFLICSSGYDPLAVPYSFSSGVWYQIAATYGGPNQRLYVNGAQIAATNYSWGTGFGQITHTTTVVRLGASTDVSPTNCFAGRMDDVRVYPLELASNQVFGVYQVGGDLDNDGLTTWQEYLKNLNPTNADTDGDLMSDGWEVLHGFNPLDASDKYGDKDADGAENYKEFLFGSNPDVTDTDGDGMPDGFEVQYAYAGLSPVSTSDVAGDYDGDGLNNLDEYRRGTSPANGDSDGDFISDGPIDPDGSGPIFAGPDPNPTIPAPGTLPAYLMKAGSGLIRVKEDPQGRPVVAWRGLDAGQHEQIYVAKWFGSGPQTVGQWAQLDGMWEGFGNSLASGGLTAATGGVFRFDLALYTNGNPSVAWTERRGADTKVYFIKWNGTNWAEIAGSTNSGIGSGTILADLQYSPSKHLYAYSTQVVNGVTNIMTNRIDYTLNTDLLNVSAAIDPINRPWIAYTRTNGASDYAVQVKWSDGNSGWFGLFGSDTGTGISGAGQSFLPTICLDLGGLPCVAYWRSDWNVYVKYFDGGSSWLQKGGGPIDANGLSAECLDMLIDRSNRVQGSIQRLDYTNTYGIFVRRDNGASWQGYGGSDAGLGLARANPIVNTQACQSLWFQTNGNVGIFWNQDNTALLAKQWNGSSWVAIGNSTTGNGVSPSGMRIGALDGTGGKGSPIVAYADQTGPNASDLYKLIVRQFTADTDGDGLSDTYENSHGLNSANADTDGDGLTDGQELLFYGTSATNSDTDGDGLTDGDEINGTKTGAWSNPFVTDTDGDGISDGCDAFVNSPTGDNDGDGIPDGIDPDDDNDGWTDTYELTVSFTNPLNPDSNCNGIPDGLEGSPDTNAPTVTIIEPVEGANP